MLARAVKHFNQKSTLLTTSQASQFSTRFPNHKELFADDYYNPNESKQGSERETPYDHSFKPGDDFEDYDKPTHRRTPRGGILSSYKKQLNLSAQDIVEKDYWTNIQNTKQDITRKFNATKPEVFTKEYTMRIRLQRDVLGADYEKDGEEYGNYEKFDKNKIEWKNDEGQQDMGSDPFLKNYNDMLRKMKTNEGDSIRQEDDENFAEAVNVKNDHLNEMIEKFNQARNATDFDQLDQDLDNELRQMTDIFEEGDEFKGRMSPFGKEMVYRSYLKGATIKDLSLRFGILPQRVKAIVWQKHLYWEEVYPKLGEQHLRAALETEVIYAQRYPFCDYGTDLNLMAELDKGVRLQRLADSESDSKLTEQEQNDTDLYISKMPRRKYDKVPINFVGKGPGGYLLYDMTFHKTNRAAQVTQKFKDTVRRGYTEYSDYRTGEHLAKKERIERLKVGGPRFASMKRSI